jgi:hypothetical protein
MNEMKPCPICKREHEIDIDAEFGGVMFRHKNFDWNKDQCLLAEQELSENVSVDRFVEIWNSRPIEDQLRAENERLKEALEKIYRLYVQEEYHLTALKMAKVAQQALNEVKE